MGSYPHMPFARNWRLGEGVWRALGQCEAIIEAISSTPLLPEDHQELLRLSLTKGAQATTAIEGNTLSIEDVARVADGQTLPPSKQYQEIEVRNILDAYNTILTEAVLEGRGEFLTSDLIRRFHQIIGKDLGTHLDAIPGRFRTDNRRVGPYRTPDYTDIESLVEKLCDWHRREFRYTSGQTIPEAIIQAIVAHVYIEWIHPFGDGNGRTGRLVEFYILIRAGCPDIASHILSNFYNETRPEYYRQLHRANQERDLTCFVEYALQGLRDGLRNTLAAVHKSQFRIAWRKLVYDAFAERRITNRNTFNRQRTLMLVMPTEPVPFSEVTRLNPTIESLYEGLSYRTAKRDLEALEGMGLVHRDTGDMWRARKEMLVAHIPQRRNSHAVAPREIASAP